MTAMDSGHHYRPYQESSPLTSNKASTKTSKSNKKIIWIWVVLVLLIVGGVVAAVVVIELKNGGIFSPKKTGSSTNQESSPQPDPNARPQSDKVLPPEMLPPSRSNNSLGSFSSSASLASPTPSSTAAPSSLPSGVPGPVGTNNSKGILLDDLVSSSQYRTIKN
jgi:hypothetical protein